MSLTARLEFRINQSINQSHLASGVSIIMSTLPDPDPRQTDRSSQVGQAEPTINEPAVQELRSWNEAKLLEWIQQKLSVPLKPDDEEKFLNARIDGEVFSNHPGDREFFIG